MCQGVRSLRILSNSISLDDLGSCFQLSYLESLTFNWEKIAESNGKFVDFSQFKELKSLHFLDASLLSNVSLKFPSSIEFITFHGNDIRNELKYLQI